MKVKVLFAKAGEVNSNFNVFTAEALRDLAARDERCTYDETTETLWVESDDQSVRFDVGNKEAVKQ
jgi:hypothetical protein